MDDIVLFNECSLENINIVGKKAAFLAELYSKGFNVPEGYIITGNLFVKFVELTGIKQSVAEVLVSDEDRDRKALKIQQIILNTPFPEDMADFIYKTYARLGGGDKEAFVSLKVSSTSDHVEDSFFLNIIGKERLINGIKSCWASVFSERNLELKRFKPSVIVQKMVNPVKSGYVFSRNPMNGSSAEVFVQACNGLGNAISLGQVIPSAYVMKKEDSSLSAKGLKEQKIRYGLSMEKMRTVKEESDEPSMNVLDDYILRELVKLAMRAEERMDDPVRISFAIDKSINVVSARPIDVGDFQRRFREAYNLEPKPEQRVEENTHEHVPSESDHVEQGYAGQDHAHSEETGEDIQQMTQKHQEEMAWNTGEGDHQHQNDHEESQNEHHGQGFVDDQHDQRQEMEKPQHEDDAELLKYYQPEVHHDSHSHDQPRQEPEEEQIGMNTPSTQAPADENLGDYESQDYRTESRESFMSKHMPEEPNVFLGKARFMNSMNIVNSDMIITSALKKRYRTLFAKDPPSSRDALLGELKTRVQVPYEDEIRRIRVLRDGMINDLREPKEEDISFAVSMATRFTKEF